MPLGGKGEKEARNLLLLAVVVAKVLGGEVFTEVSSPKKY
jgi:hypothetical protein